MATGNIVELVVELKTKGKEDLANYSKELKSFSKLMEGVVKSSSKYAKNASEVEKANKKMASSQTNVNTQLKNNQEVLVSYNTSLDNNANKVKNTSSSYSDFNTNLKTINTTVKNVGGALAIVGTAAVASAVGLGVAIKSITDLNKQMEVFARQGSLGVEEFKSLAFATEQYGITADQIADKMKDFEDRVGEAATAGTGVFLDLGDVLGLTKKETQELAKSMQNLTGRDGYLELVRLMEQANVSAAQMTFALESVGNDMSRLIPLWKNGGKELERLEKRYKDMSEALALSTSEQKDMILLTEQVGLTQKALSESAKKLTATFAKPLEEAFLAVQNAAIEATEAIVTFYNRGKSIDELQSINDLNNQIEASKEIIKGYEKELENIEEGNFFSSLADNAAVIAKAGFDPIFDFSSAISEAKKEGKSTAEAYLAGVAEFAAKNPDLFALVAGDDRSGVIAAKIEAELERIAEAEERLKVVTGEQEALKAETGGGTKGAINQQEQNTIKAIQDRFKTDSDLLDEKYKKEKTLLDNQVKYTIDEQKRLNKALLDQETKYQEQKKALEEKFALLYETEENKKQKAEELAEIERNNAEILKNTTKNLKARKKEEALSRETLFKLEQEYAEKSNDLSLKLFDEQLERIQKADTKLEYEFSIGEIDINEYEKLKTALLDDEELVLGAKAGFLTDTSRDSDDQSVKALTAQNQLLRVEDERRILADKVVASKREEVEGTMEVLNAEIAIAEASGDSAKAQDLRIRLFIEETKLRTDIDELVKKELISQRVKLANQQKINDDIKKEQDFRLKLLEDQIEIAKAQDDEIKVIERQLALELEKIGYNEDYTDEQKEQLRLSAMAVANEEIRNEKLEEANKLLDEENKNRKKALEEIRDLELELADLKGISNEQSLIEQRDAALKGIDEDESIPDEEKDRMKSLTGQIFDEKIIDAQFEALKTKYQQLIIDLGNATSLEDQIGISQEIRGTIEQMGQIEGIDANQMRDLAEATNEWNESLMGVNFTLQDFNNALVGGLTDAFMDIVSGTKDAGEAFQDMAFSIVESMLEIYAQQLLMQALGVDSGGNATGSGLFGAIGGMFGGSGGSGGFSFFHNGGSPSDAMVETRDVKSLQADETMAVIRNNETVMTKNEYNNITQGNNKAPNINQQLVLDPADLQRSIGKTDEFEQNIITVITSQQRQIKDILS